MFSKQVRKRLQERNWLSFIKNDKNPPQAYRRLRDEAVKGINDLGLLASILPEDKQYEIFNEKTLKPLIQSIFLIDRSGETIQIRKNPNLRLASYMVQEAVRYCLSEFRNQNKHAPESSRPTVEYLERAVLICKEISRQHLQDFIEQKAVDMRSKLICIWEQKFSLDFSRFAQYISQEMKLDESFLNFREIDSRKINEFHYILWTDGDDPERYYDLGEIKIIFTIDKNEDTLLDNNHGSLIFFDQQKNVIKSKKIRIKKVGAEHALFEIK